MLQRRITIDSNATESKERLKITLNMYDMIQPMLCKDEGVIYIQNGDIHMAIIMQVQTVTYIIFLMQEYMKMILSVGTIGVDGFMIWIILIIRKKQRLQF